MAFGNFVFADTDTFEITDEIREEMYGQKSKISANLLDLDKSANDNVRIVIELEKEPVIKHATAQGVKVADMQEAQINSIIEAITEERNETLDEMSAQSIDVQVLNVYENVFNGFSMTAKYGDIEKISELPNVKRVSISKEYALPEPEMTSSSTYTKSDIVNAEYKYKGEGIVVSIIDSGIDFDHKDMELDENTKVALTENEIIGLVQTENLPGRFYTEKVPYGYNYMDRNDVIKDFQPDVDMHGMHVAGTVGANGEIKGVAPNVQLLAMKVFSNDPSMASTFGDIMVAAMDDSVKLGADVMNLSIGATAQWVDPNDPEQVAVRNATEAGIIMSISAGNSAFYGNGNDDPLAQNPDIGVVGSPGLSVESIQVASADNYSELFVLNVNGQDISGLLGFGADRWENKSYELTTIGGKVGNPEDFEGVDVAGKVVLVKRGAMSFYDKTINALNAGAAGIIVYDHGLAQFYYNQGNWAEIPFMMMPKSHGEALEAAIANGLNTIEVSLEEAYANPTSGYISSFSSWGTTPNLDFKPELTAPGGDIYSTLNDDKYGKKSGTSMAAPHVAGGAALIVERVMEEDIFPESVQTIKDGARSLLVKNILMNTAVPIKDVGSYGGNTYQSVRQQGAGNMNLLYGVETTAVITDANTGVAKVNVGELAEGSTIDFTLRVKNYGTEKLEYNVSAMAQINSAYDDDGVMRNALTTEEVKGIVTKISVNDNEVNGLLTVPAGGEVLVRFEMDLSNATMYDGSDIMEVFTNGNYIEGFAFFDLHEEDLNTAKQDAKIEYDAAVKKLTKISNKLIKLQEAATKAAGPIADLEAAIIAVENSLETLKTDNADTIKLAEAYATAEEAYATAALAYEILVANNPGLTPERITELETLRTVEATKLQTLEEELKTLKNSKKDLVETQEAADEALKTAQSDLSAAKLALETAQNATPPVQDDIDAAQALVTRLEGEVAEKQTAADNAKTAVEMAIVQINAKKEAVDAAKEVVNGYDTQITEAKNILADMNTAKEAMDAAEEAMKNAEVNLTEEVKAAYLAYVAARNQLIAEKSQHESDLVLAKQAKADADAAVANKQSDYDDQYAVVKDKKAAYESAVDEYTEALPLSVPFLGFYGDFGQAPGIDELFFEEDSFYGLTGLLDQDYTFLGQKGPEKSGDLIAISPNGDGYNDDATPIFSFLRNMTEISYTIEDAEGQVVRTLGVNDIQSKDYFDGKNGRQYTLLPQYKFDGTANLEVLPDGQYYYVVTGKLDDADQTVKTFKVPVKVDTVKPVITGVSHDKKAKTVTVDVVENGSGPQVFLLLTIVNDEIKLVAKSYTNVIDVSDVDPGTQVIPVVSDMAANEGIGMPLILNDTTKPEVSLDLEALGVYNSKDLTFTGKVLDFFMPTLTINGTDIAVNPDGTFEYEFPYVEDGFQSLYVVATDVDGNELSFTRDFYIDSEAPVLTVMPTGFDANETTEYVDHTVTEVKLSAKFEEAVFPNLTVKLNGNMLHDNQPDFFSYKENLKPYTYDMPEQTITLKDGENKILLTGSDAGGNLVKFEKIIVRLEEGQNPPTSLEFVKELVNQPEGGVSNARALSYEFEANAAVDWKIEVINPQGEATVIDTVSSDVLASGTWAPEVGYQNNGTYTIKATATEGESTIVSTSEYEVYNYSTKIMTTSHVVKSGMLYIEASVKNFDEAAQDATIVVQMRDGNNTVFSINLSVENIKSGETEQVKFGMPVPENGDYEAEVFVWDDWATPNPLSDKNEYKFELY